MKSYIIVMLLGLIVTLLSLPISFVGNLGGVASAFTVVGLSLCAMASVLRLSQKKTK